jgi:hypothetical protein
MPFVDTLRHALEQLRAKFKADVPPHKVGDEELTVDPALQGVEKEVRQGEVEFDGLVTLSCLAFSVEQVMYATLYKWFNSTSPQFSASHRPGRAEGFQERGR